MRQEGSQPFLMPDLKATLSIASCVSTRGPLGNIIHNLKSQETDSGCHEWGRGDVIGLGTQLSTLQIPALPTQNNQEECSHCQGEGDSEMREPFVPGKSGKAAAGSQGHQLSRFS